MNLMIFFSTLIFAVLLALLTIGGALKHNDSQPDSKRAPDDLIVTTYLLAWLVLWLLGFTLCELVYHMFR